MSGKHPDGAVSVLDDPARTVAACALCDHQEERPIELGDDWPRAAADALNGAHARLTKHLLETHPRAPRAYWVRILNADDHVRIVDPAVWGREL